MAASAEKLVERTLGGEDELNLVTISDHAVEASITLISLSPIIDSPAIEIEVIVETRAEKGDLGSSSEGREHLNL